MKKITISISELMGVQVNSEGVSPVEGIALCEIAKKFFLTGFEFTPAKKIENILELRPKGNGG